MKISIACVASLAALSLAACDNPKPAPATPAAPAATAAPGAAPAPLGAAASANLPKREEMAGFSLDMINQANDPFNVPATVSTVGPMTMSGFAFDPVSKTPGKAVDVTVNGTAYPTTYGHLRQDVADYHKLPVLANTGWTVELPQGTVPAGRHTATVRVVSADGASFTESPPITFVVQ